MPIADVNGIKLHYRFDGSENGEDIFYDTLLEFLRGRTLT